MAEPVTVTLYSVSQCHYLEEDTGAEFGSLGALATDLSQWLEGLATIGESVTFEPKQDDPFLSVYCFDARKIPGKNAYLFATWNESESQDDTIQLLRVDAAIGHADVSSMSIDALSLPGYPAYFVVLPDERQLLNLRFEHRLNGSRAFKRYIEGFLTGSSQNCVWDPRDHEKLLGYAEDKATVTGNYLPHFEYQLVRRPGNIDWLRGQVSNIRKVVRKAVVRPIIEEHRTFLDSAFNLLGMKPNRRLKADIHFEYEFKTHLDIGKLEKIIERWASDSELDDSWNDVGFEMARASGKPHWLSGSYARDKAQFDVPRTDGGMHDTEAMAELLGEGHLERLIAAAVR